MSILYIHLGKLLHYLLPPLRFKNSERVRVAILSKDGYILLVRNWFGYQNWSLPGGGVKRAEHPKQAAARELFEETGIRVAPHTLKYLGVHPCYESKNSFQVKVYYVILQSRGRLGPASRLEIVEASWHALDKLPQNFDSSALKIEDIYKLHILNRE